MQQGCRGGRSRVQGAQVPRGCCRVLAARTGRSWARGSAGSRKGPRCSPGALPAPALGAQDLGLGGFVLQRGSKAPGIPCVLPPLHPPRCFAQPQPCGWKGCEPAWGGCGAAGAARGGGDPSAGTPLGGRSGSHQGRKRLPSACGVVTTCGASAGIASALLRIHPRFPISAGTGTAPSPTTGGTECAGALPAAGVLGSPPARCPAPG